MRCATSGSPRACARRLPDLGVDFDRICTAGARCGARQRRTRPSRGLLHGEHGHARHRRARLRHPLRPRHLPPGAAATAGSTSCPRSGCRSAIRGSSSGPRSLHASASAARSRTRGRRTARTRSIWHPGGNGRGGRLRHADRGLARAARQHAAAVVGAGRRPDLTLADFNRGDHVGALADRVRLEAISRVLYPSDETAGRPGPAAAAGVLLRLGLAAGPRAPAHARSTASSRSLRRSRRDPAQRHASGDRRAGADAPAGRRARHAVGRGLGRSPPRSSTTPITRCCPRRWRPGRCDLLERLLPRHMQIIYRINARAPRCATRRRPR